MVEPQEALDGFPSSDPNLFPAFIFIFIDIFLSIKIATWGMLNDSSLHLKTKKRNIFRLLYSAIKLYYFPI